MIISVWYWLDGFQRLIQTSWNYPDTFGLKKKHVCLMVFCEVEYVDNSKNEINT